MTYSLFTQLVINYIVYKLLLLESIIRDNIIYNI